VRPSSDAAILQRTHGRPRRMRAKKPRFSGSASASSTPPSTRIPAAASSRAPPPFTQSVVHSIAKPLYREGGIAVLKGNLAPGGAIIKQSAADPKLMEHEGRAVVFDDAADLARRIDSDELDVKASDVLVLKNIGPKGAPGMPEAGYIPIPRKLARAGVKMNHIPYKGGNAPALALLSGEVPVLFTSVAGTAPQIESGKMRMLAVTTKKRFTLLPAVPTVAETVLPEFDALAWYALAGPKKLPQQVVARANELAQASIRRPDIAEKLLAIGAEPWATSPREAQEFLASEVARWTKVIREEKIAAPN